MFLSGLSIAVKTDDKNNTIIVCVHFVSSLIKDARKEESMQTHAF